MAKKLFGVVKFFHYLFYTVTLTLGCISCLPSTDMMMVTPINDLHGWEPGSMVKGERLMRCKLASVHRLFDLFGWAQSSRTCLTVSSTLCSHKASDILALLM